MKQISPEWIKEFLKNKGMEITTEEAEILFKFMKDLAKIEISHYLTQVERVT